MSEYQETSYEGAKDSGELTLYRQRMVELIADTTMLSPKLTNKRRELLEKEQREDLTRLLLSGLTLSSERFGC